MLHFRLPGWTYDLQGRLRQATRLKGIQNFKAADFGLVPLRVDQWGPFVFVSGAQGTTVPPLAEWLGEGGRQVSCSRALLRSPPERLSGICGNGA